LKIAICKNYLSSALNTIPALWREFKTKIKYMHDVDPLFIELVNETFFEDTLKDMFDTSNCIATAEDKVEVSLSKMKRT
jgi:hypothetical protein